MNSEKYQQNEALFALLDQDKLELENQGYGVVIIGDYNAHVKESDIFQFDNYPHPENENGFLLKLFAERNNMCCLNTMTWSTGKQDGWTYKRYLGKNYVASIIDYALITVNVLPLIADLRIEDTGSYAVTSDHATLVLELDLCYKDLLESKEEIQPKYNMKWDKFETELKRLTAVKKHNSESMGVEELSSRIESVFMTAKNVSRTKRPYKATKVPKSLLKARVNEIRLSKEVKRAHNAGMQESRDSALKNLSVAKDKRVKIQRKLEMRRILKLRSVIRAGGKKGQ